MIDHELVIVWKYLSKLVLQYVKGQVSQLTLFPDVTIGKKFHIPKVLTEIANKE